MKLNGTKFHFLGDSITQGAFASSNDKRYFEVFAKNTGAVVTSDGIGGTRIAPQIVLDKRWEDKNEYFLSRVPKIPADTEVIVIFGGTNDFGHGDAEFGEIGDTYPNSFCGAFYCLLKETITRFPNATVIVMTPLHRFAEDANVNNIGLKTKPFCDYVKAEKEIAEYFSVPVLDLWAMGGMQPFVESINEKYMTDGVHPSDAGNELIARRLEGFLKSL